MDFWLRRLEIERQRIRLTDSTRASEDLSRRQKRQQRAENWRRELRLSLHEVILVTAKRGSGVMVYIVLDERHTILGAQGNE